MNDGLMFPTLSTPVLASVFCLVQNYLNSVVTFDTVDDDVDSAWRLLDAALPDFLIDRGVNPDSFVILDLHMSPDELLDFVDSALSAAGARDSPCSPKGDGVVASAVEQI